MKPLNDFEIHNNFYRNLLRAPSAWSCPWINNTILNTCWIPIQHESNLHVIWVSQPNILNRRRTITCHERHGAGGWFRSGSGSLFGLQSTERYCAMLFSSTSIMLYLKRNKINTFSRLSGFAESHMKDFRALVGREIVKPQRAIFRKNRRLSSAMGFC